MSFLIVLLLIAVGVWFLHRRRYRADRTRGNASAIPRRRQAASSGASDLPASAWQVEDPPAGQSVHLSTNGRLGIVGEAYRDVAIGRVVRRRTLGSVGDWENGLVDVAILEREPTNPYDRHAVRVRMAANGSWVVVGYIAAERAQQWHRLLDHLSAQGATATCKAMIYRDRRGRGYQIVLHVPDPDEALPGNSLPAGATRLDAIRMCAVVGEQHYQDVLSRLDGLVWATLHPSTVPSGKYSGDFTLEVRIDDHVVGTLTAAQGRRYAQLLKNGSLVACEATVAAGTKKREVNLRLPRVD